MKLNKYKLSFKFLLLIFSLFSFPAIADEWPVEKDFQVSQNFLSDKSESAQRMAQNKNGRTIILWRYKSDNFVKILAPNGQVIGEKISMNGTSYHDIGMRSDGGFIYAYYDYPTSAIYYDEYDANAEIQQTKVKINQEDIRANNYHLRLAGNEAGQFVIVWANVITGKQDIYAAILNSDGTVAGTPLQLTNTPGIAEQQPDVAIDKNGNFVVAWYENSNGIHSYYLRKFSLTGTPLSDIQLLEENSQESYSANIDITMNSSGYYMVSWFSPVSNSNGHIVTQRFNANGAPIGNKIQITAEPTWADEFDARLFNDNSFVISWYGTYFQRYNADGTNADSFQQISKYYGEAPLITGDSEGNFTILWKEDIDDSKFGAVIVYQKFSQNGTPYNPRTYIDFNKPVRQIRPAIGCNSSNKFIITWESQLNQADYFMARCPDVLSQSFLSNGEISGENFFVNKNVYDESYPAISVREDGSSIVIWTDDNATDGSTYDVLGRCYDNNNQLVKKFKINDRDASVEKGHPAIAVNSNGQCIIVWNDLRDAGDGPVETQIYGQRYDGGLNAIGSNFRINTSGTICSEPTVAIDENGNFVVVWTDNRNGNNDIFARLFNTNGIPQGSNFQANVEAGESVQKSPAIDMAPSGNYVITWLDNTSGKWQVFAQQFAANSSIPSGANFKVSDVNAVAANVRADIAFSSSGKFIVAWQDSRRGDADIYAQKYNAAGQKIERNYRVNDANSEGDQKAPQVVINNETIYFTWEDLRNPEVESDIFARVEPFAENEPTLTISHPKQGEIWTIEESARITWESSYLDGMLKIELSTDLGYTWQTIGEDISCQQGYFDYIPAKTDLSANCYIKITSANNTTLSALSNEFNIFKPVKQYWVKHFSSSINPITIDGNRDEAVWQTANPDSLLAGGEPENWLHNWSNFTDNLVTWSALWSMENNKLYLFVQVEDDKSGSPDNQDFNETPFYPFNDESLEIYIDGDHSGGSYSGQWNSAQQWIISKSNDVYLQNYHSPNRPYSGGAITSAVSVQSKGNWSFEAEIEIYDLFDSQTHTLTSGDVIGWDLWYNDSDNETRTDGKYVRDQQTGWYYTGRAYYDADCFGELILEGLTVPVELEAFNGYFKDQKVFLTWNTASETNNYGFEIQRSLDQNAFATLGFIKGNGTSSSKHTYSFVDDTPLTGNAYYRLQQIDYNGESRFSSPIMVSTEKVNNFSLLQNYPNPFNPVTTIAFEVPGRQNVKLVIYNTAGQEVAQLINGEMTAGIHRITWNARNLPSGIYFAKIGAGHFQKIIKLTVMK